MSESFAGIGIYTVWAIGVGSALGGDFFGWELVLYGGFTAAVFAVLFAAFFYWIYACVLTELAARYKSHGGAFSFVCAALGKRDAAIMGVLSLLKLILANAATAMAISSYMGQGGYPSSMKFVVWICLYGIFTAVDCIGIKQSAGVQVAATMFCVGILFFICGSNFTIFTTSNLLSDNTTDLHYFLKGLPFALQFFDGFEEIPLLYSYAENPMVTIPRGIIVCYVSVAIIAMLVLVSGAGVTTSETLVESDAPLMIGIEAVYGAGSVVSTIVAYTIVVGLVVNFFAFVVFSSQLFQSVSENRFLPSFLAYRHPEHGAPIYASITSSVIGIATCAVFTAVLGDDSAQNTLLTASLLPSVITYIYALHCMVKIRNVEDKMEQNGQTRMSLLRDLEQSNSKKAMEAGIEPPEIQKCRELEIIGDDPENLRYRWGRAGARVGQVMCFILLVGLVVLAYSSWDYFYGLIVVTFLTCLSLTYIFQIIPHEDLLMMFQFAEESYHYQQIEEIEGLLAQQAQEANPDLIQEATAYPASPERRSGATSPFHTPTRDNSIIGTNSYQQGSGNGRDIL